ncbi:hypothetical protein FACS189434_09380 [Bacteroidia bacterium]|nr:hypothetical protein FACS189434_09380 [Bacteroidia bacterium]
MKQFFYAFNPNIYDEETNSDSREFWLIPLIGNVTANPFVIFKSSKEMLDGRVIADISKYTNDFFADVQTPFQNGVYLDNNLIVAFAFQVLIPIYAVNGAAQIGESSDLMEQINTFRTKRQRVSYYEGYPLSVTMFGDGFLSANTVKFKFNNEELIEIAGAGKTYITVDVKPNKEYIALQYTVEPLQANSGETIRTNTGEIIYVSSGVNAESRLLIDNKCTPSAPFYVRWINLVGGWDYFMFSCRQIITRETKQQATFKPTILNTDTATGTEYVIDKSAAQEIKAGADMISEDDFISLNDLPMSNKIQYYDKARGKWFDLLIDKSTIDKITGDTAQSVEFTFITPEPQTPF